MESSSPRVDTLGIGKSKESLEATSGGIIGSVTGVGSEALCALFFFMADFKDPGLPCKLGILLSFDGSSSHPSCDKLNSTPFFA